MINALKISNIIALLVLFLFLALNSCSEGSESIIPEQETEIEEGPDDMMENEGSEELTKAPSFSLKTNDDEDLSSEAFADKVLVIFFFGNSCPPCKSVAPDIEKKLNKAFSDNADYAIIGIDQWDGNVASVTSFKKSTGVTFPLGLMGSDVAKAYGTTYDRLVVVNKEGKIAYNGRSIAANNLEDVETLVKTLLN